MTSKEQIVFDVFGRRVVVVEPTSTGWAAYYPGADGKRRPADFAIPSHLDAKGIVRYLDDLFHEHATEAHPKVRIL
jgi:hypothetical protein